MSLSTRGFVLGCNKNICNWQLFTVRRYPFRERKLFASNDELILLLQSANYLPYGFDDKLFFNLLALSVYKETNELFFSDSVDLLRKLGLQHINSSRIDDSLKRLSSVIINFFHWFDPSSPEKHTKKYFQLLSCSLQDDGKNIKGIRIRINQDAKEILTSKDNYWSKLNLCEFNNLSTTARHLYLFLIAHIRNDSFRCNIQDFGDKIGFGNYARIRRLREKFRENIEEINRKTSVKSWIIFDKDNENLRFCGAHEDNNKMRMKSLVDI